jgi:YhcH/YjgK/YiaL family protein
MILYKKKNTSELLDKFKNINIIYNYLKDCFSDNSEVFKRLNTSELPIFSKVILSDTIFALEQKFYTQNRDSCFFESHLDYIDIHISLSGLEVIEISDIDELTIKEKYSSKTDKIIYNSGNIKNEIILNPGDVLILFEKDAHLCAKKLNKSELVVKTVLKIPIKTFNELFRRI